ncbi:MBG domain-containing protein [Phenylobacterium sp.]|uniref:MBG domain-containing protein n=1 Tax=Phenylobacterium sp. TaxID=1871053 RepID=UPI0030F3CA9D
MSRTRPLVSALLASTAIVGIVALSSLPAAAQTLPTGGEVASGGVAIGAPSNGALSITQSTQNAIVNWQSFNVGVGSSVTISQPNASAAILNRVTGATSSTIAGQIVANGQVFLINPNGIVISGSGKISAGAGFVASTLNLTDDDFNAGRLNFTGDGASAGVSNAGLITVGSGGYAALIGGEVSNTGVIVAPMGKVGLGSGEAAVLDLSGDGFLQVSIPTNSQDEGALVANYGTISADGGSVVLTAAAAREMARQAVNMSGVIEARSVSGRNGAITLSGGEGVTAVSGRIDVSGAEQAGGAITVTGRDISLTGAALDASGATGGGEIRIGGDWQGGGDLQRAETTTIDADSRISADATGAGDGGLVVVWSDRRTRFAGTISARSGQASGDGGQAEVSGKAVLDYTGYTDLTAANGAFGDLLLDPYNVTISSGTASNQSGFAATGDDSVINVNTLQTALAGANVTVSTGSGGTQTGNITVADAISWTAGTALTLTAATNITINAPITFGGATGAGLFLNAPYDLAINAPIQVRGIGDVAVATNNLMFGLTGSGFTGGLTYLSSTGTALTSGAGGTLSINGKAYTLLYSMSDVESLTGQNFGEGYFALARDLDARGRTYDDALIGNTISDTFYGTLEGLGHVISDLTIVSRVSAPIGLIGRLGRLGTAGNGTDGVVRNIGLVGGSVTGIIGAESTGGLVGANSSGSIINAYNTGTVSGDFRVGGLVGINTEGRIISSYATGAVSAVVGPNPHDSIGGLVGLNIGDFNSSIVTVINSYATGTVSGGSYVGGLIGASGYPGSFQSGSRVTDVYATGAVHGAGNYVGGVAGFHYGGLTNAYATGAVSGADYVGGVAGRYNGNSAFSTDFLYATGAVSGRNFVGGLIGYNTSGLRGPYATGAITGAGDNVGGLIGTNGGFLETVYATGAVSSTGNNVGGLVGDNGGRLTVGYATGEVRGADSVGGLVGFNWGQVIDAYATGAVTGANHVGGLVGLGYWASEGRDGTVTRAYATGAVTGNTNTGGLVGFARRSDTIINSYWNVETSGRSTSSAGGTGLTTAQMRNPFSFIDGGWNFAAVWATPRTGGAPVLRGMTTAPLYDNYVRLSGNTSTTYGDTMGASGITLGGIGAGNVSVGWGSAISASINAGTYAYGANNVLALTYSAGVASDYYVDYGAGALTVGQRAVTVTADALSRAYGDANPALTYTVGGAGLVNGDTLLGALATTATSTSNVGSYGITQGSLAASTNYAVTYSGANLTVGQRALTVTADALSRAYGDANPALTYTVGGPGIVNGDTLSGALATMATQISDVGVYGITQGTLAASSNYALTYAGANLTVIPRNIAIGLGVTADNVTRAYGDANPALTWTVNTGSLVNGDTLSGQLATDATSSSGVGGYAITQGSLAAPSNYLLSFVNGILTVTARPLTVTANALSRSYGDVNPALTYTTTGLVNGDTLSGLLATSATTASNVGVYGITQGSLAASGNYALTYAGANLTVVPRSIAIGLGVTADSVTRSYGDANPAFTWTLTNGGLVNGDTLSGQLATSAAQFSGVGQYAITQGSLAAPTNYTLSFTDGVLTVAPRAVTVTANALSRIYGDANPALTYAVGGGGLVNGDALSGSLATTAALTSNIGVYGITQGSLANTNYTIAYTGADLAVTRRALTIAANALSRTYGDVNPTLTYTTMGLVNGDTLTGALATAAVPTSNAGLYDITRGTLSASANYEASYTGSRLTVGQRGITVTADPQRRAYGVVNPPLTYTLGGRGLVGGDTLSGGLTTEAGVTSFAGDYVIGQGTLVASDNYSLVFQNGVMTVFGSPSQTMSPSQTVGTFDNNQSRSSSTFAEPQAAPSVTDPDETTGLAPLVSDPRFDGLVVCTGGGQCVVVPEV